MGIAVEVDLNAAVVADVDAAVAANDKLFLYGYSAKEGAGTPAIASFSIVNGATGAAAGKVVHVALLASTSETVIFERPIACPLGISVDWIAGDIDIILYHKTL